MYFSSFRSFASWSFYEFNFLTFAQRFWIALNVIGVNEKIFASVIWCDEAKAFLCVEKLNCTFRFCHGLIPYLVVVITLYIPCYRTIAFFL